MQSHPVHTIGARPVGHLFGVALDPAHTDGLPINAGSPYGDVMLPTDAPRASSDFGLTSLHKIRSKTKPGLGP